MIRHIVMAKFKPEIGQREREEFVKKTRESLSQIPGTQNVAVGLALEAAGKARYETALFVDFENEAALKSYDDHPIHQAAKAQIPTMFSDFLVVNFTY
jgi:quinol monooxygenase YgiN